MEFLEGSDAVGYFLLATATVKLLLWFKEMRFSSYTLPRHLQGNGEKVLVGRVSKLFVYPVKSMSGIEVTEMRCKAEGPSIGRFSDREFLLTSGDNHEFVTARQVPRTLLIRTTVDGNTLKLAADGMTDISINIDRVEEKQDIRSTAVHGMATVGLDCGDDVGRWLDEFLGPAGYRLIYASSSTEKRSVAKATEKYEEWAAYIPLSHKMNYQDTSPVHLLSEASVEDLNTRITTPVTMRNFRPNILVSGCEPYAEDTWNRVFIGETEMSLVKLCGRCVFTTINPATAEKSPAIEPLKTMRRFRKLVPKFGDSPCFGVNLNPERLGMIKVGDPVYAMIGSVRIEP